MCNTAIITGILSLCIGGVFGFLLGRNKSNKITIRIHG